VAPWSAELRGAASVISTLSQVEQRYTATARWRVGTDVEYSIYVEFGTSKMAAQPYLRPAIEEARRNADSIFSESSDIDDFLRRLALFIEREAKRRCPVDTGRLRASIEAEKF
jgi:hypothetical protein